MTENKYRDFEEELFLKYLGMSSENTLDNQKGCKRYIKGYQAITVLCVVPVCCI